MTKAQKQGRRIRYKRRQSVYNTEKRDAERRREEDTMEEKRFLTRHDASRLWHIEAEELRRRCAEGRIEGAKQVRGIWLIPQ